MKFSDHFSANASEYVKYRPVYPQSLFHFLAGLSERKELAWDSATGNGQAAIGLTPYFRKIIATDASSSQIRNAIKNPKITYIVTASESTPIKSSSVDLVTVATAIHWLRTEKFYKEVKRVARENAIIAVWNYFESEITTEIDEIVNHFSENLLKDYWPAETKKIKNFEEKIPFPFERIHSPEFFIEANWTLSNFLNYLSTWSSVQNYLKLNGTNPLKLIYDKLADTWGEENKERKIRWRLKMKTGFVR